MQNEQSVEERVAKGIELLNRHDSNWFTKINLLILNQNNNFDCVLGQLFGSYSAGKDKLFESSHNGNPLLPTLSPYGCGFWDSTTLIARVPTFTNAWKKAIVRLKITLCAYEISQSTENRSPEENWFRAEREIKSCL